MLIHMMTKADDEEEEEEEEDDDDDDEGEDDDDDWSVFLTSRKCFLQGSLSDCVSTLSLHHLFHFRFMDSQQREHIRQAFQSSMVNQNQMKKPQSDEKISIRCRSKFC